VNPIQRIGLDVDGVLAELHGPWARWIETRFGVDHYEFDSWTHPEDLFGKAVYDFLTPTVYSSDIVKPIDGAVAAVEWLHTHGYSITAISSCYNGTAIAKEDWCRRHGFLHATERFVSTFDKHHLVEEVDVLVDDSLLNVRAFTEAGGFAILLNHHHNRNEDWSGFRLSHIGELVQCINPFWRAP
jgi:5'(3')-deoxyribonucleotidase